MRQVQQLATLFLALLLLAGCGSADEESLAGPLSPVPTEHPRLANSNPTPAESVVTEDATSTDLEEAVSAEIQESVTIIPDGNDSILAWITSTPSIGHVIYGRTVQYELGEAGDDLPSSQHAITLPDLEAETTYYYQITMIDASAAITSTFSSTFETIREVPTIDVWYGTEQSFGQNGTPQRWINILGNVSDEDGVRSLTYALNGGEELPLSIGPDRRRLVETGDFNIDIFRTLFVAGENELVLRAVDTLDHQEVITMSINYAEDAIWSGNYAIDWSTVSAIQDVAEVVDGLWEVDEDMVRTTIPGYQRLLAIGDVAWTEYEVVVPITIHTVNFSGEYDDAPGIGLLVRWTGHTDIDAPDWQPKSSWLPFGAVAWYRWDTPDSVYLRLEGTVDDVVEKPVVSPPLETTFTYKLRVETAVNGTTLYRFKVWEEGRPEPEAWSLENESIGTPNGSLLLLAHQVDASFGDVTITQLAPPTSTPFLPNLSVLDDFSAFMPLTTTVPITTTLPITESSSISCTVCTVSMPAVENSGFALLNPLNHFMMLLQETNRSL